MASTTLNDTPEEELRCMLVDKNNECNALRQEIIILKENVAEEQAGKYLAYAKFINLQKEMQKLVDADSP